MEFLSGPRMYCVEHFGLSSPSKMVLKALRTAFTARLLPFRSSSSPAHFSTHFLPTFRLLTMLEGRSPIMHCCVIKVNHPQFVNHIAGGVKLSIHHWESGALAAASFPVLVTAQHIQQSYCNCIVTGGINRCHCSPPFSLCFYFADM